MPPLAPRLTSAPAQINRYKLQRANTVSAAVEEGALPSRLLPQILEDVDKLTFPPGLAVPAPETMQRMQALAGMAFGVLVSAPA